MHGLSKAYVQAAAKTQASQESLKVSNATWAGNFIIGWRPLSDIRLFHSLCEITNNWNTNCASTSDDI
ncbi:hypothetical protein BOTCAL_0032g00330 [Botryotinia calthae]|uniref:Uncharacterized protein n=1 Tax=Botryotinia calthae TaxID=38488 RepID=A0A4Y8DDD9_9HELO|nr:hypothetical protein BOTCAL_0032g00330 [Botryotinia calthae]